MASKRDRHDRILTGFITGITLPLVIFLITYFVKFSEMNFQDYLNNLWQMKIFMKLLSICVFPNLGFFLYFYKKKYDMAARGVIMATFVYAFLVLITKLI
ncbi:MAG: hypothetical protein WC384_16355 [Prolixibacteraceae bacterium]|jgi:sorbitol-specific phosphotransferase system component IIC